MQIEDVNEKLTILSEACNKQTESKSSKLSRTLNDICKAYEEKDFFKRRHEKITKTLEILNRGNNFRLPRNRIKKRKTNEDVRVTRSSNLSTSTSEQEINLNEPTIPSTYCAWKVSVIHDKGCYTIHMFSGYIQTHS